jgi:hypothetical protein
MNLELIRLIKYETTVDFLDKFKKLITSTAKEQELASASLNVIVDIVDQLHEVPENELSAWFHDKEGIEWETIFNAMLECISNYIRTRHLADGDWIFANPAT